MRFTITLLTIATVIIISCNNDDDNPRNILDNSSIIRVDDDLFLNAPNNALEITSATITDNNLNLTIDYGGGCGDVYYDLVAETTYLETNPIQKNIRLAFYEEDFCEAIVELELSFNLTPIQLSSTDTILINLDGWEGQIEYNY